MRKGKKLKRFFKRFFQVKRVIVVTDEAVEYYPLSRSSQFLIFAGVLGAVAWASYSTGSFVSAQNTIAQKDRTIQEVNLENKKIESQFSLLKRDLVRMHDGDKGKKEQEMSEYTRFIIKQYSGKSPRGLNSLAYSGVATDSKGGMVMDRISFLEQRVEQLKQENQEMVVAVRRETGDKIKELNMVIGMTGLNSNSLASNVRMPAKKEVQQSRRETVPVIPSAEGDDVTAQGGPLVPYTPINIEKKEKALFANLKRMMVLYEVVNTLPLNRPILSGRITSGYGRRADPFTHSLASHMGVDFSGPAGTKVLATNDGVVESADYRNAYGNMVEVDHGLGISTRYGHLKAFLVRPGQKIRKGQVIGIQGSTGRSTGNHVHYEVRYRNEPLNPMRFIKAGTYVSAIQ